MLLIDTYNCVHAGQAMGGVFRDLNVRRLCDWLAGCAAVRGKVTLVLDGRPKPDEPSQDEVPEVTLRYSGAGVSADDVIGQLVELHPHRKKVTVVSNDRAVVLHARKNFAHAISCETLLDKLVQSQSDNRRRARQQLPQGKTSGTSGDAETELWLEELGFKPGTQPRELSDLDRTDIDRIDMDDLMK